ncbi:MAG: hypothetical protein JWO80_6386, partial [Bryobacterales bacterium]|nr:hypothetical protein [Bryobacterales bacterium]
MFEFLKSHEPWVEHLRDDPAKDTVTLIPGTWGHGPWNVIVKSRLPLSWRGSPLTSTGRWFDFQGKLAVKVGLEAFNVHVLHWSERNSVSDRRIAAATLKSHLEQCIRSSPGAEHCVIAHSHGGNIAAMAFAQMDDSGALQKIHFAAMSTPFIWFQVRGLSSAMKQAVGLIIAIALIVALSVAMLAGKIVGAIMPDHMTFLPAGLWHVITTVTKWIAGILVFSLACMPITQIERLENTLPSVLSEAEQISSSRIMKRLGSVLILQAPADEAWLGLTIPALGMWVNRGVGWILSRAWKIIFISFGVGVLIVGAFAAFGIFLRHFNPDFRLSGSLDWVATTIKTALWLIYIAPLQGIIWLALAVIGALTLRFLGYGMMEGIGLTIAAEVHVEHYPAGGPWEIFCPSKRMEGFHHSLYESPEVQEELAR